jgi:cyclic pyranopterin phosphate synthase
MPEADTVWLPRVDILHFEEIETLVDVFTGLGVDKVRITGGDRCFGVMLPMFAPVASERDSRLAMTTNGVLLAAIARALKDAGCHRLHVSLDTLQPERFGTDALTTSSIVCSTASPRRRRSSRL